MGMEMNWKDLRSSDLLGRLTTKWSKKVARGKRVSAPPLVTKAECSQPEGVRRNRQSPSPQFLCAPTGRTGFFSSLIQGRRFAGPWLLSAAPSGRQ